MSRGGRSTSWRWALVAWVALIAAYSAVILDNSHRITAYERGVTAASVRVQGRVVATEVRARADDLVQVVGVDAWGREARWTFRIRSVSDLTVGDPFWVMWAPEAPGEVYPADQSRVSTVDHLIAGIVVAVLGASLLVVGWTVRLVTWWRTARAPARRYRATLLLSYGKGRLAATPWLRLTGDGVWFQRVMWEPWLTGTLDGVPVQARRVGRRGALVVDVPGQGRLWPAGRARRREPSFLESLEEGGYDGALTPRWPILFGAFLVGVLAWAAVGPTAGVAAAVTVAGVALFYGGPPVLLAWRRRR